MYFENLNYYQELNVKCIIIGQNSENSRILKSLLEKHTKFSVLSSFDNFNDSSDFLESITIDIIFIFFNIPEFDPFKFLDSINSDSNVVFISDQIEYAFQSFNYNVLDYINLPLNEEKIMKINQKLNKLHENNNKKPKDLLYLKSNLKKKKVYTKDIKWVEALGDYVKVVTTKSNIVVLSSLKNFEDRLPVNKFLRIHKSFIINLDRIDNISSKSVEIESTLIPISRNKKPYLDRFLESK